MTHVGHAQGSLAVPSGGAAPVSRESLMAHVVITLRNCRQSGTVSLHCTAHGVRDGSYGDLWHVETELVPDGPDATSALRALSEWIQRLR